jgi:ABC-2 type transport system ATP-binding protein
MSAVIEHVGPAVSFRSVSKTYGLVPALSHVSFDVARGEVFGLVGGNGAGKTTLIKCALDFCRPDTGAILLFGRSSRITSARGDLAFLPERFNPPYYLTGRDFLRYMAELHRREYNEDAAQRALASLDLDVAVLERPVRAYSKGMTQKLGVIACLLSGKALQLLDEPASGLDPKARALLKRQLRSLAAAGRTIFLTSHALSDVEEICDRIAVLHGGHVRFVGAPAQLVASYRAPDLEQAFLACTEEVVSA